MQIVTQEDDAEGFVAEVRACVSGIIRLYRPGELFLVKTNTWFGPNWLGFSGKAEGALGVWKKKLTLPPFVPHRVLSERRYAAPDYKQEPIRNLLHFKMPGANAQKRYVSEVAPAASLLWYSGSTRSRDRGSIMAYLWVESSYWAWYTGWAFRNSSWKIAQSSGATIAEIDELGKTTGSSQRL